MSETRRQKSVTRMNDNILKLCPECGSCLEQLELTDCLDDLICEVCGWNRIELLAIYINDGKENDDYFNYLSQDGMNY